MPEEGMYPAQSGDIAGQEYRNLLQQLYFLIFLPFESIYKSGKIKET